jgi:aromatic-L-amino-acid decarboxylase
LKLWLVLRWYGVEGLRAHIRAGVRMAADLAEWMRADGRFEVLSPQPFSLICFRLIAGDPITSDAANEDLLQRLNATRQIFLTSTRVDGRYTLRLAIGAPQTTPEYLKSAWSLIQRAATPGTR